MVPSSQAEIRTDASAVPLRHWVLAACVLGFLWFTLINQLGAEWAVNPQYAYGWAVPFLALYLLIRRVRGEKTTDQRPPITDRETTDHGPQTTDHKTTDHRTTRLQDCSTSGAHSGVIVLALLLACALTYLPTRLIQEANPEWRLVSWALALEVIGITFGLVALLLRLSQDSSVSRTQGQPTPSSHVSRFTFHFLRFTFHASRITPRSLLFPLLFFLVAVPWPTLVEVPIIQWLARANAASTIEILGFLGFPALQHGNLIEVGTGVVGIDEACSGIRSVQATLMLSLFFGELYSLAVFRRIFCVVAGFGLAFLFNIGRTTLLTLVAARKGMAAIDQWHDPAGATILVGCFICLWLVAKVQAPKSKVQSPKSKVEGLGLVDREEKTENREQRTEDRGNHPSAIIYHPSSSDQHPPSTIHDPSFTIVPLTTACLALWLAFAEIGTELWYRLHEARLSAPVCWDVNLPRGNAGFRMLPPSQTSKQFLHFDDAINASWREADHSAWQVIFLRWKPGRVAVHLARNHTPDICLAASGRRILSQSNGHIFSACGLRLPFNVYRVKDESGPFYVFYCLWDDRAENQAVSALELSYARRLGPVLEGRRNSGQRSLEVAVWGIPDEGRAEAAFENQLQRLIRLPQSSSFSSSSSIQSGL
ncbi:MAG: hypothetical protein C5B50_28195 [Verrucomicrobia bacterium]|nr:MAG: hypothetical protein C5B50_28195 [Verrucomicrobiota bacterium]